MCRAAGVYIMENPAPSPIGGGGSVPDKRSRILEVVVVRRVFNLGTGNLEWGGSGKGLRKGKSVYE
jgi:hypothetical protein